MTRGARARILPDALSHNLDVIRQCAPGTRVMAAVKGNAYGHGLITAASVLTAADSLAVARLSEALSLRDGGIDHPLVLLGGAMDREELASALACRCELVVHTMQQLELLEASNGCEALVWLKIDTGMHRLGFAVDAADALIRRLRACRAVRELRLMTHLATADNRNDPLTRQQFEAFRRLSRGFDGDISIANSAAIFDPAEGSADAGYWGNRGEVWVRPGIALYGISPFAEGSGDDLGLKPAMQFTSRLIDVKPAARGTRVGYGGRWQASRDTVLGIVAAGYGDGYTRFLPSGTPLLVNGRRVPLAGIVSMDLAAVDLGPGASDRVGDRVILWGDGLPVEEVARAAGTIPYQLVTGVLHREPPRIDG